MIYIYIIFTGLMIIHLIMAQIFIYILLIIFLKFNPHIIKN